MSAPGRPKRESLSAQREGSPMIVMPRILRWAVLLAGGALLGTAFAVAIVVLVAAAGGVLTTPPGAWIVRLGPAPGVSMKLSVPGLVRFVTSPFAQRLLDGRAIGTRAGRLRFARDGDALAVRCAPCRIEAPKLSSEPIHLDELRLRLRQFDTQRLAGELNAGGVVVPFSARLRAERIDIDWQLPPTAIADLYRVLAGVIPEAHLARIDGSVEARGSLRLPQQRAKVELSLDGFAVDGLGTEKLADDPIAFACPGADGSSNARRIVPGEGRWISPAQSGHLLAMALLAAEDQRFNEHEGFDPTEIARVLSVIDERGVTRGASTITQQAARTLFVGPERTGVRKLRELLYAVEMERTLGKRMILALYLNTVHWGPGICGADAAARSYFGKRPHQLTPLEAAWLASILPQPAQAYADEFLAGRADGERAGRVLRQMRALPRAERERWAEQPIVFAPPPRAAQLAARR